MTYSDGAFALFLECWTAGFGFSAGLHFTVWAMSAFKTFQWVG